MISVVTDVSELTNIPMSTLNELINIAELSIGHNIYEKQLGVENTMKVDIGIGVIVIRVESDKIMYKFVPSEKFETKIVDALNNKDVLRIHLCNSLNERIESTFRRLL